MNHARTDPPRQDARCGANLAKLVTALGLRRIRFLAAPPTDSDRAELDTARAREYLLPELTRGGARVKLALEIQRCDRHRKLPENDVMDTVDTNVHDLNLNHEDCGHR